MSSPRSRPRSTQADRVRSSHGGGPRASLAALPWLAPAVLLILGGVLFPAGVMVYNSTRDNSITGGAYATVECANYAEACSLPSFSQILSSPASLAVGV